MTGRENSVKYTSLLITNDMEYQKNKYTFLISEYFDLYFS